MSRRRFVREIKSKEVKNINPSDIIYLAMKDGSIILITDDDEDLIEYDDIKLYNSFKRKRKYYNKKLNTNNDDSLYEFETEKNYKTNTNSYKTLENNRINSTSHSTINIVQNKTINNDKINISKPTTPNISQNKIIDRMRKKTDIKDNERKNKIINNNITTHQIKNEKLDKSFERTKTPRNNLGYHEIEYINNPNIKVLIHIKMINIFMIDPKVI